MKLGFSFILIDDIQGKNDKGSARWNGLFLREMWEGVINSVIIDGERWDKTCSNRSSSVTCRC